MFIYVNCLLTDILSILFPFYIFPSLSSSLLWAFLPNAHVFVGDNNECLYRHTCSFTIAIKCHCTGGTGSDALFYIKWQEMLLFFSIHRLWLLGVCDISAAWDIYRLCHCSILECLFWGCSPALGNPFRLSLWHHNCRLCPCWCYLLSRERGTGLDYGKFRVSHSPRTTSRFTSVVNNFTYPNLINYFRIYKTGLSKLEGSH